MTKRKSKGAYMISSVAEMYGIHPQTLRLYEREGLLKPSRTEGNTRLYTDEDLQRLEFILSLARDLGVNISGIAIILQMRERMEEMQVQIHDFVKYIQEEVLSRATAAADPSKGAIVPVRRHLVAPAPPQKTYSLRTDSRRRRQLVLMLPFKLIYSDDYFLPIGAHVFPAEKYRRVHDQLSAMASPTVRLRHSTTGFRTRTSCWSTRRSMYRSSRPERFLAAKN